MALASLQAKCLWTQIPVQTRSLVYLPYQSAHVRTHHRGLPGVVVTCTAAAERAEPSVRIAGATDNSRLRQLLGALTSTRSYTQLAAIVRNQEEEFLKTPLCVYALLHAVQLKETISDEQYGKGSLATEEQVLQQLNLVEELLGRLCDAAEPSVTQLPLPTQATLALALAQLDYYHAPIYTTIAQAVLQELADKVQQPQQPPHQPQQQQAAQAGSVAAPADNTPPPSAAVGALHSAVLAGLPESLVPGALLSLTVAYSLNGHYDAALLDELAGQAVAFRPAYQDAAALISMSAALLDLQHYSPALLTTAADIAVQQEQPLELEEVVPLLLALGFFRIPAPEFVKATVATLADDVEALLDLEPLQLSRLWKALLLLREQDIIPPAELLEVFAEVQEQLPDFMLLGSCRAAIGVEDLEAVHAADPVIRQQWEEAGLLAPAQILQVLQSMGYQIRRGIKVAYPDLGLVEQEQQQQQQQRQKEGQQQDAQQITAMVVDVCLRLQDGRQVAVLVLDDSQYCHFPPNRLRGAAAVDMLVLQSLGLAVLPLPLAEWQALAGDELQQKRYLEARLAAATS